MGTRTTFADIHQRFQDRLTGRLEDCERALAASGDAVAGRPDSGPITVLFGGYRPSRPANAELEDGSFAAEI
ncbi:MAG: hypothetical protein SPI77_07715 [Corynebacterium sp.]|nr:hypothetical protein [Corynebacterium sp.]